MKYTGVKFRTSLLHGAGTAALASLIATGAQAGETIISPASAPVFAIGDADGHAVINGAQYNYSPTTAEIVEATVTSADGGTASTVSATVDSNAIRARAAGTDFTNTIDLSVVPADTLGTGAGAASLNFSLNIGGVTSTVELDSIGASYSNFVLGSLGVTNDTISATATGNNGSTALSGTILPAYASDTPGSSSLIANSPDNVDLLNASGSLVASTAQFQLGAISTRAEGLENEIYLTILSQSDDVEIVASPELADNTIAINATGNSSTSTIGIEPGGAATFAGSAVITNGQLNGAMSSGAEIVATNQIASIEARISGDNSGDYTTELQGSLAVTGNAITTSATGNKAAGAGAGQAGNQILLADGASFSGSGHFSPTVDIAYDEGEMSGIVYADLIIQNSQGNSGAGSQHRLAIVAESYDADIGAAVYDIDGGSVTVSNNEIVTTANGNSASSAIATGDNTPSFSGTAALANQQVNYDVDVTASNGDTDIYASVGYYDGELPNSSVSVNNNKARAAAFGSSSSQSVAIDAVDIDLQSNRATLLAGTGGAYSHGNLHADGSVTVSNLQGNYNTDVSADQDHWIGFYGADDGADSSSVEVKGNVAEAVAAGASAASSLALSGVTVGTGAGIVSLQVNDDSDVADYSETDIRARSEGSMWLESAGSVESSALDLTGNLQRAVAYGGTVANTLSIDAETITVADSVSGNASLVQYYGDADDGRALTNTELPIVDAAYGLLNVQSLNGDVGARALGWDDDYPSFGLLADGNVLNSSLTNSGNAVVAAAYGADALNAAGLTVGTLDTSEDDFATVMNLTNVQETTDASSVSAQVRGNTLVGTDVWGDVTSSTVSTSLNTVQALANANRATNAVVVRGTDVDTAADENEGHGDVRIREFDVTTDASFSLSNAQVAGGEIEATFLDEFDPADAGYSLSIRTDVGDDVYWSTIASDGNVLNTGANGNRADNLLDLGGNTLSTTTAIANLQVISAETRITSRSGTPSGFDEVETDPGTPDTDPAEFTFAITGTDLNHGDGVFTQGTLYVDVSTLTQAQIDALEEDGWSNAGENTYTRSAVNFTATITEYGLLDSGGEIDRTSETAFIPGTPPTYDEVFVPGTGGVFIAVDDLHSSTVSVNGNAIASSVLGNSVSNALKIDGNGVADGNDRSISLANIVDGLLVEADHSLASEQVVHGSGVALISDVYGTFAITAEDDSQIVASTLSVDGNSQSSSAVANTADNRLQLEATSASASTALASSQQSGADVVAASDMEIFAPVVSFGSHVSLSDNTNFALAVHNNVTNTLTVETTNGASAASATVLTVTEGNRPNALGDHVLLNDQFATDTAQAEAVTTIVNWETGETAGLHSGSVTVSGNTTLADASANRAVNVANVNGSSTLAAPAGVVNTQYTDAEVTSLAVGQVGFMLAGDSDLYGDALNGSSVAVAGNSTTALARGNGATNVLNYAAGASYGQGMGVPASAGANYAVAQAAVLNSQANAGPVSATAANSVSGVALNNSDTLTTATGSSVQVTGNAIAASAYGNTANNTVLLASLNTDLPTAALTNAQVNSGAVSASVVNVTYGITTSGGSLSGSSALVAANQVTANAVGNSAVNTIGAR